MDFSTPPVQPTLHELFRVSPDDQRFRDTINYLTVFLRGADTLSTVYNKPAWKIVQEAFQFGFPDGVLIVDDVANTVGYAWHYQNHDTFCIISLPETLKASETICYSIFTCVMRMLEAVWCIVETILIPQRPNPNCMLFSEYINFE